VCAWGGGGVAIFGRINATVAMFEPCLVTCLHHSRYSHPSTWTRVVLCLSAHTPHNTCSCPIPTLHLSQSSKLLGARVVAVTQSRKCAHSPLALFPPHTHLYTPACVALRFCAHTFLFHRSASCWVRVWWQSLEVPTRQHTCSAWGQLLSLTQQQQGQRGSGCTSWWQQQHQTVWGWMMFVCAMEVGGGKQTHTHGSWLVRQHCSGAG
jgi:hypothetical protein